VLTLSPSVSLGRYKWHTKVNATSRDGDFEAGIIIHEMTHGLTTRLTGGPADSSCLGWGEAGGYGEGSGDFFVSDYVEREGESAREK
jgi:extracellular elastinolytic metalloproteinase